MSSSATPATQSEGGCHEVPRLPRRPPKVKVDVTKGHAYHAKWRWMSEQVVWWQVVCEQVGRREADGRRDTEPKTRTPHKDVGKHMLRICSTLFFFVEHHSSPNGHFWPVFPTKYSQIYFPERIQAANMDDGLRCTTNQSLCDGTLERSHADIPKQQSLRATD